MKRFAVLFLFYQSHAWILRPKVFNINDRFEYRYAAKLKVQLRAELRVK